MFFLERREKCELAMGQDQMSVRDAVAWAAANYESVVSVGPHGGVTYAWDAADGDPPNNLGRPYMVHAATNPTAFFGKIVPQFLGDEKDKGGVSDEELAEEKKSIAEVRKVLRSFTEEK